MYLHGGVSEAQAEKIRSFGATVHRCEGDYEASVVVCKAEAAANGWQVVQDVAWEGYTTIPATIFAGYSVLAVSTAATEPTKTQAPRCRNRTLPRGVQCTPVGAGTRSAARVRIPHETGGDSRAAPGCRRLVDHAHPRQHGSWGARVGNLRSSVGATGRRAAALCVRGAAGSGLLHALGGNGSDVHASHNT